MITPNRLTAVRILIALVSPVLLIAKRSLATEFFVLAAFTVACVTDWWDGHLARTKAMETQAGKIADPIADKLLISGLMAAFAYLKLYAFEWVVPIVLREAAVTAVRLNLLRKGRVIPAEWAGKVKIGFQIGSIYATLVFLMAQDSAINFSPALFQLIQILHYLGIFLAVSVTVVSGLSFFGRLAKP